MGDLRFRLPLPNEPYNGTFNATAFGQSCPEQDSSSSIALVSNSLGSDYTDALKFASSAFQTSTPAAEDCEYSAVALHESAARLLKTAI